MNADFPHGSGIILTLRSRSDELYCITREGTGLINALTSFQPSQASVWACGDYL